MPLKLMYITNRLPVALIAERYGVDRVWIDLETIGKEERQRGQDTVKSKHRIEDIRVIKPHLTTSEMLVRVNHWYEGSVEEINKVIDAGADVIMLPYWKTAKEVQDFISTVNGRCRTTLLLETKEAVECLDDVLTIQGIDEIHIGLNDLHLAYGLTFMFELLTNGTVEKIIEKIRPTGIVYGFGGIAKIGDGLIPAEMIIMEHYYIGSTRAILSRTFCNNEKISSLEEIERVFKENMRVLRAFEEKAAKSTEEKYRENREKLKVTVKQIVYKLSAEKNE